MEAERLDCSNGAKMKNSHFIVAVLFLSLSKLSMAAPDLQTAPLRAPVCLFSDLLSGPASGGEGGNGTYLTIFGKNFGASRGSSTVSVNGHRVAQYLIWDHDYHQTALDAIGVQLASGTSGTGAIVVTTKAGSCRNLSFTVRPGHIYFIGPTADNSSPGNNCRAILSHGGTYESPWGLTDFASKSERDYNYAKMRTPLTYYHCLAPGDILVFLDRVSYPYFDGGGRHASLTPLNSGSSPAHFITIMGRPGAHAQLGGEGWAMAAIRPPGGSGYHVYSGLVLTGSGANGAGINSSPFDRIVGNVITCPSCWGPAAAFAADAPGFSTNPSLGGVVAYGNVIYNVSNDKSALPNGSNKTYHAVYFAQSNFEFAWNRIYATAAYNGLQVHHDESSGYYDLSIHDNDIADVNGSGINLSAIDPASGFVQVYNNIIHHTGVASAPDSGGPHSCLKIAGYGSAVGAGTAYIFNNTMFDCSSYLNSAADDESCVVYMGSSQKNVTTMLMNNIAYQPAYTYTSRYNVYVCSDGLTHSPLAGSHNLWYSASKPGSVEGAAAIGAIKNPEFVSSTNGSWTNYALGNGSPARKAGLNLGPINESGRIANTLTWDFAGANRANPPSIGALD